MSNDLVFKGACLCNKVQFNAELSKKQFHICHCDTCRGQSGGPFMAAKMKNMPNVESSNLRWYSSSDYGERGFCDHCGASLFWRLKEDHEAWSVVSVGALKDAENLILEQHIFIDSKPEYYDFKDNCPRLTAEEVFELAAKEYAERKNNE